MKTHNDDTIPTSEKSDLGSIVFSKVHCLKAKKARRILVLWLTTHPPPSQTKGNNFKMQPDSASGLSEIMAPFDGPLHLNWIGLAVQPHLMLLVLPFSLCLPATTLSTPPAGLFLYC